MNDCIDKTNLGKNLEKERGGNLPTLVSGKGRDGKRVKKYWDPYVVICTVCLVTR